MRCCLEVGERVEYKGRQYMCVPDDILAENVCEKQCAFYKKSVFCALYECRGAYRPDMVDTHFVRVEGGAQ